MSTTTTPTNDNHTLRFPPFPPIPPGVQITPFSQFRECGIQIELGAGDGGDTEVDGRGIPTIELRAKHDNDESKSEARKRKKSRQWQREKERNEKEKEQKEKERAAKSKGKGRNNRSGGMGKPVLREWWQDWEEGEHLRRTTVDLSTTPLDRIHQAVYEFWKHRRWPAHSLGVWHSWDKIRYYIGVLDNPDQPIPGTTSSSKNPSSDHDYDQGDDGEDIISDEEEFADQGPTVHNTKNTDTDTNNTNTDATNNTNKPNPRHRYDTTTLKPPPKPSHTSEEKLISFLADPERSTKVFLSSYMRVRGMMWSERNLIYVPKLLIFFFNYLIRSAIFDPALNPYKDPSSSSPSLPSSSSSQPTTTTSTSTINTQMLKTHTGLIRALSITEQALEELPLTSVLAQWTDPWGFSDAARVEWGRRADGYKLVGGEGGGGGGEGGKEEVDVKEGKEGKGDVMEEKEGEGEEGEGEIEVQRCVVEVIGLVQDEDDDQEGGGKKKKGRYADSAVPDAKRVKLDKGRDEEDKRKGKGKGNDKDWANGGDGDEDIEERLKRMKVPEVDEGLMAVKTAIEDNMGVDVDVVISPPWMKNKVDKEKENEDVGSGVVVDETPKDAVEAGGWGGGWGRVGSGNGNESGTSWGNAETSTLTNTDGWGGTNRYDSSDIAAALESWDQTTSLQDWVIPRLRTFGDILGSPISTSKTGLTQTHAPGMVESSLRRIKAVLKPGEGVDEKYLTSDEPNWNTKDPEEMEAYLGRRFVRIVLEPWLHTDVRQEIGKHSIGRIERRCLTNSSPPGLPGKGLPFTGNRRINKVHNLLGDEITVLVDAKGIGGKENENEGEGEDGVLGVLEKAVGMGLGGYFVELARVGDLGLEGEGDSDVEMEDWDERDEGDGDDWRRYWYMEELSRVYPSYWLPLGLKKREVETLLPE